MGNLPLTLIPIVASKNPMPGFLNTYCSRTGRNETHDIYVSSGGHLHSLCTACGKDVGSTHEVAAETGHGVMDCPRCSCQTAHLRYESSGGHIHWFCASCGRDIGSSHAGR